MRKKAHCWVCKFQILSVEALVTHRMCGLHRYCWPRIQTGGYPFDGKPSEGDYIKLNLAIYPFQATSFLSLTVST